MTKLICIFNTETNGLQSNVQVSKKNLYKFSRMIMLNYAIGYYKDKKINIIKQISYIVKPRCMYITNFQYHNITQDIAEEQGIEIETILENFINDIKNVKILISHNCDFHLKTILAEAIRYNINIDLSSYMIIDVMSFNNIHNFVKLNQLYEHLYSKKIAQDNIKNQEMTKLNKIIMIFIKLYNNFKKEVKLISKHD